MSLFSRLFRRRRARVDDRNLRLRVFAGAMRYARARDRLRGTPIETRDTIGEIPPQPMVGGREPSERADGQS